MDLVRLSSRKKFKVFFFLLCFFIFSAFLAQKSASPKSADQSASTKIVFENYGLLQKELLESIHRANQRLWIASNEFTDQELFESLIQIKLKKPALDIVVLINTEEEASVQEFQKRFERFKEHSIRFGFKKNVLKKFNSSTFLVDQQLIWSDNNLAQTSTMHPYTLVFMQRESALKYGAIYTKLIQAIFPVSPQNKVSQDKVKPFITKPSQTTPPPGVSMKLPKMLKWEK